MSTLRAFTMPKWGIEMLEGTISEWSIREGEPVTKGQTIALIESDKIVNEVQAELDTTFVRLIGVAGETYPVGALLGVMAFGEVRDEDVDAFIRSFGGTSATSTSTAEIAISHERADSVPAAAESAAEHDDGSAISPAARSLAKRLGVDVRKITGSGRHERITLQDVDQASKPARRVGGGPAIDVAPAIAALDSFYASPAAKRLALDHGVDLAQIRGTGPRSRISRKDVARSAGLETPLRSAGAEIVRMSPMRKAIARQLSLSKSTIPHFYLRADVNLESLIALRTAIKQQSGSAPSLNDYLLRAAALALIAVPDVNIQVHGDEIHRFARADIAVAVATDKGLITPVVRAAETKSVQELARELRPLIERARAGRLRADEIEGGTFTVSNLGMFGVEQFDAIINPPQGAILAIGASRRRQVERDGAAVFASVAALSLSCDHRAIDGAVGGRFLTALREFVESPERL